MLLPPETHRTATWLLEERGVHNEGFIPPVHDLDEEDEEGPREEVMPRVRRAIRQEEI